MSLIQKAVTFVKKKWATGDTVLPDDLNRYEDSIDNLCKSKLNIADIVNGLDSNDPSKVLAATQGKALANRDIELSNQIKVLSEQALMASEYNSVLNLDAIAKSNTYQYGDFTVSGRVGAPDNYGGVVFHKQISTGYAFQTANSLKGVNYERVQLVGIWKNWVKTGTSDEITALYKKLGLPTTIAQNGGDANSFFETRSLFVFNIKNLPYGYVYGFLETTWFDGLGFTPCTSGVCKQIFKDWDSTVEFTRTYSRYRVWSEWVKIATTDKIDISNKLQGGWVKSFGDMEGLILHSCGKTVSINGAIRNGNISDDTVLFNIENKSLRPLSNIVISAGYSWYTSKMLWATVRINGDVIIRHGWINEDCVLNFSYPTK